MSTEIGNPADFSITHLMGNKQVSACYTKGLSSLHPLLSHSTLACVDCQEIICTLMGSILFYILKDQMHLGAPATTPSKSR